MIYHVRKQEKKVSKGFYPFFMKRTFSINRRGNPEYIYFFLPPAFEGVYSVLLRANALGWDGIFKTGFVCICTEVEIFLITVIIKTTLAK